ncbi:hypothetical protein [Thermococcus sp. 21S9]|uniref:hypothetical protein n=1 Tax=Thermococcus sp. 21S9 TaxID=1638223 RepID=UPI00143BE13C|nr:hypothetical protein [Thermococcus sp. 21S9]NJE54016.1 hypothetical protein [Thermococcus sp. 21S9]
MAMEVPYVLFEVHRKGKTIGTYAIDAYFVEFLALEPRKAVLIKGPGSISLSENAEKPLPRLLGANLERFLKDLYRELLSASQETREKRVSHMRRWNVWRILGIPTGHSRHIAVDEQLAKVERENALGLALLKKVLGVKDDVESVEIREVKLLYRRLWLENGEVRDEKGTDKVYTNLLKIDPVFRTAFYSALLRETALTEEIRKKAQAFS